MIRENSPERGLVSGLRTRFSPRSRINQGLISAAPWLDVVMLLLFFSLLDHKLVMQPGVVVDLPAAEFVGGLRGGYVVVLLSVETANPAVRDEIVVFDDERFRLKERAEVVRLREAFARVATRYPELGLIVQADKRVSHGATMLLLDLARLAGVREVNLASREAARPGDGNDVRGTKPRGQGLSGRL